MPPPAAASTPVTKTLPGVVVNNPPNASTPLPSASIGLSSLPGNLVLPDPLLGSTTVAPPLSPNSFLISLTISAMPPGLLVADTATSLAVTGLPVALVCSTASRSSTLSVASCCF